MLLVRCFPHSMTVFRLTFLVSRNQVMWGTCSAGLSSVLSEALLCWFVFLPFVLIKVIQVMSRPMWIRSLVIDVLCK